MTRDGCATPLSTSCAILNTSESDTESVSNIFNEEISPPVSPPVPTPVLPTPNRTEQRIKENDWIKKMTTFAETRAAHYKARNLEQVSICPYPKVNWANLRPNIKKNLPLPTDCPVLSCPQDSNEYPDSPDPQGRIMRKSKESTGPGNLASCPPEWQQTSIYTKPQGFDIITHRRNPYSNRQEEELMRKEYVPTSTSAPFGSLPGFYTSQGIIAPPRESVGGYVLEGRQWILHAAPSRDPTTSSYY